MKIINICIIKYILIIVILVLVNNVYSQCKDTQDSLSRKRFILRINKDVNNNLAEVPYIEDYYIFKNAPFISVEVKRSNEERFLTRIKRLKFINGIYDDGVKKPYYFVPNDPLFYDQWYADFLGLPYFWVNVKNSYGTLDTSENVVIAIIDTGVDLEHPELKDTFWVNKMEVPGNEIDDDANGYIDDINGINSDCMGCKNQEIQATECSNHGTFIAGIISAQKNNNEGIAGIGPNNIKLLICKAGTDSGMPNSSVYRALDYIIEMKKRGVNIVAVNMAYGGEERVDLEEYLLSQFDDLNIMSIIAAGNEDRNIDLRPIYPASYRLDNSIVVGSIDQNGRKSSFSNYGLNTLDIFAPGEMILTTAYIYGEHGYGVVEGTSISSPMVAAAIAYLYQLYPDSSIYDLKRLLIQNGAISLPLRLYGNSGRILDFRNLYSP